MLRATHRSARTASMSKQNLNRLTLDYRGCVFYMYMYSVDSQSRSYLARSFGSRNSKFKGDALNATLVPCKRSFAHVRGRVHSHIIRMGHLRTRIRASDTLRF